MLQQLHDVPLTPPQNYFGNYSDKLDQAKKKEHPALPFKVKHILLSVHISTAEAKESKIIKKYVFIKYTSLFYKSARLLQTRFRRKQMSFLLLPWRRVDLLSRQHLNNLTSLQLYLCCPQPSPHPAVSGLKVELLQGHWKLCIFSLHSLV